MANAKYGAKEVMDATLYDMDTGAPVISFDTLKTSSISVSAESVSARGGRGNAKLVTWEYNKEGTFTVEDALITPKSLELISGMASTVGSRVIYVRQKNEYDTTGDTAVDKGAAYPLTCTTAGVINLAWTPLEAAANIRVYLASDDCGERIDMTGATLSGKTLTLSGDGKTAAASQKVIVYYTRTAANAQTFTITADKFAGTYKLVGDTVIRNAQTGKDEPFQVVFPNLKWKSNLELGFTAEGDPATTSFECDIMRASDSSTMIELVKYED